MDSEWPGHLRVITTCCMHNSRITTIRRSVSMLGQLLFWIPVAAGSLLLIYNTIPYFSFEKDFRFIEERSFLFRNGVYNASFYLHIAAGAICIGSALLLFSRYILKKHRNLHRAVGKVYVSVVLAIGAPTGLYMAFFAKGGFWERSLFVFMAGWWFITTLNGLNMVRKKNIVAHKIWMIRSYAMALTAVSFRVFHILFYLSGWGHLENYEISLWISVLGNMLLAEWVIWRQGKNYLRSFAMNTSLNYKAATVQQTAK